MRLNYRRSALTIEVIGDSDSEDMSDTRVIQITNIAPSASKDQMRTLFGYLGRIEEIKLYPEE